LVLRDREAAVRKPHASLKERTTNGVRTTKAAVDFSVQRANKCEPERRQYAQLLQHIKPGCPSVDDHVVRPFPAQTAQNAGQGAQCVNGTSGIEAPTRKDFHAVENGSGQLACDGGKDGDFVPARHEFERKQGDLKFCTA
jgi:hypothetical protein